MILRKNQKGSMENSVTFPKTVNKKQEGSNISNTCIMCCLSTA